MQMLGVDWNECSAFADAGVKHMLHDRKTSSHLLRMNEMDEIATETII